MSTEPRTPSNNEARTNLPAPSDRQLAKPPIVAETGPSKEKSDLSDNDREHLVQLFDRASAAHELAEQGASQFCKYCVEAGMALLEAHDLCPKKRWSAWLRDHFDGSERTAQRYMKQAKTILMGGGTTALSLNPSEELSWQFTTALMRLERRRAAALPAASEPAKDTPADDCAKALEDEVSRVRSQASGGRTANDRAQAVEGESVAPPPRPDDNPLLAISALFDQLIAALGEVIESGQRLDYGQFVLDELKRLRDDVDACHTLLRDAHILTAVFV